MMRRMILAIDVIAFTALVVASLMIAAGVSSAAEADTATGRKADRASVAQSSVPSAPTVAHEDFAARTTTLTRVPVIAAAY